MMSDTHKQVAARPDATPSDPIGPECSATPDQGYELAASIVETLCALPTVPTKSWCDSAAAALGGLFERSAAVVLVCTTLSDGSIRRLHGLGVAVRPSESGAVPGAAIHAEANPAAGTNQAGNPLDSELRCGLEGLVHLGWPPDQLSGGRSEVRSWDGYAPTEAPAGLPAPIVAGAGDAGIETGGVPAPSGVLTSRQLATASAPTSAAPGSWQPSSPLAVLSAARAARVVAGVASIGPPELGRRLAVYVGDLSAATTPSLVCADILSACLPLLARKASRALERTWLDRGSWLSEREKLVLEHLIIGRSVPEIATELGRSHHTVHDNVKSLHRKLSASSRGELIARALGLAGRIPSPDANSGGNSDTIPDVTAGAA